LVPAPNADPKLCSRNDRIPGFTAAVARNKPAPSFPDIDVSHDSEGWVRIGFTINAEGETENVVVLDRMGSKRMLSAAISAIKDWEYEPATLNGQPADQYGNSVEILYQLPEAQGRAVHDNVVELYDRGRTLVGNGKYAEGIEVLEDAMKERLNLFEQAMISFALAYAYNQAGNPQRALPHIRHAMIEEGRFLEKRIANPAKRLRVRLEWLAGNTRFVACAPQLAPTDDFDPNGVDRKEVERLVANAAATLKSTAPLVQAAKVPPARSDDDYAVWEHDLARRKFSFAGVAGNLARFRVNCVVHLIEDEAKPLTQFTIPEGAGPCMLRVFGESGATFKLIEEW
jgi:TonB family protein